VDYQRDCSVRSSAEIVRTSSWMSNSNSRSAHPRRERTGAAGRRQQGHPSQSSCTAVAVQYDGLNSKQISTKPTTPFLMPCDCFREKQGLEFLSVWSIRCPPHRGGSQQTGGRRLSVALELYERDGCHALPECAGVLHRRAIKKLIRRFRRSLADGIGRTTLMERHSQSLSRECAMLSSFAATDPR